MSGDIEYYEYIVVGCGGIGSSALYWLAKTGTGTNVLGLEQFKLGHHHGSSQDYSRIIRLNYFTEQYTQFAAEAYRAWSEVEEESGTELVHKTGSLFMSKTSNEDGMQILRKQAAAMDSRKIPYKKLSGTQLRQAYPQWTVYNDIEAILQPDGGLVDAALGNSVHIQLAQAHGARVIEECTVNKLEPIQGDQCLVHTNKGVFRCRRVIVASGAWMNNVLQTVGVEIPVMVTQEQVSYYATPHIKQFTKQNFPVFIYFTESGFSVYGLPTHVNSGFKIAIDAGGPKVSAGTRSYIPDPVREEVCLRFMKKHLPKSVGPLMYTKTCLYTMTLDRHFIVDSLASRGMPQILVTCGAGHAYKFASIIGKVLSELAITGNTHTDVSAFRVDREAVRNPNTKPAFWRGNMYSAKL